MEFVEYDTKSASPEKEKAANSLRVNGFHWLREQDLNLRSSGYEPDQFVEFLYVL
jgi:hypothetical protein